MKRTATFLCTLSLFLWVCGVWGSAPVSQPGLPDPDSDGLNNEQEVALGTDPNNPDSDNDGIRDGVDPDIVARIVAALPNSAFKSSGDGLRTATFAILDNIHRATAAGNVDVAVQELKNLLRHMDGCPPQADKNDWIMDCAAQTEVRGVLDILMANHSSYAINSQLVPSISSLPGLNGGSPRVVGVALGPQGRPEEFIIDEVIYNPQSADELNGFLAMYGGTVLRDGRPHLLPGTTPPADLPETTGWYLIRVNLNLSSLDDLVPNMEKAGLVGAWSFSSESAARLVALTAREYGRGISPNYLTDVHQCRVCEHNNMDAATWWWMDEDNDPNNPGDQGLSIGVIHAWEYVKYKGYPPFNTPYKPVRLAILDGGFDLDETTGAPLNGNLDYLGTPLQLDEHDGDWTAGGYGVGFGNCNGPDCWHGQMTFGVSSALSRNGYGVAGTSGGWEIQPILIKIDGDRNTSAQGLYDAIYNGADVINMSTGGECGWTCRNFGGGNMLKAAVMTARNKGLIVVASAGNEERDISQVDFYPCSINGAVCVGAIEWNPAIAHFTAAGYSNYGSVVDTWAPAGMLTTVLPTSNGQPAPFSGTSCSAPFVSGIVALMKMLNPDLEYDQVRTILWDTANPLSDDKVSSTGYVDAYRAVAAVKPNEPPTVKITQPVAGDSRYSGLEFIAKVNDPEVPSDAWLSVDFSTKLVITSSRDGQLCTASGDATGAGVTLICDLAGGRTLARGMHVITATATDPFGATATDSVTINVVNTPPTVTITFPPSGSNYYTSQKVNLRGNAYDPDWKITNSSDYLWRWTSNISGVLNEWGDNVWVSLPEGSHTITLTVADNLGATTTSDGIVVNVQAGAGYPTAQIIRPENKKMLNYGETVSFEGKATDPEQGELSGTSLVWTSNIDGVLGTGKSFSKQLSGFKCSNVEHTITLEATDSDGHKAIHSIVVYVVDIC